MSKKDDLDEDFDTFNKEEQLKDQFFIIIEHLEKYGLTEIGFINDLSSATMELITLIQKTLKREEWKEILFEMREEAAVTLVMMQEIQEKIIKDRSSL